MDELTVVGAIIIKDNKVLAVKRAMGQFEDKWMFPGSRIENYDSKEETLVEKIKLRANADITIQSFLLDYWVETKNYYGHFNFYLVNLESDFENLEYRDVKWLSKEELDSVDWAHTNLEIVNFIKNALL